MDKWQDKMGLQIMWVRRWHLIYALDGIKAVPYKEPRKTFQTEGAEAKIQENPTMPVDRSRT